MRFIHGIDFKSSNGQKSINLFNLFNQAIIAIEQTLDVSDCEFNSKLVIGNLRVVQF